MRNFLLFPTLLLLLTNFSARAQNSTKVDSMLVDIDKTTFTSGVLYNRSGSWSNLTSFNSNAKLANTVLFEQALHDLYKASKQEKFIDYKTLREHYVPDNMYSSVNIGVLNASYHSLNYNKGNEQEGALKVRNDKFEKTNNTEPSFIENHTFIAAPLKQYVRGNTIKYLFDSPFLIEEADGREIVELVANFDTNTDYTLISNGSITTNEVNINYQDEGFKTLTFTATFVDGTSITTQAVLHSLLAHTLPAQPLIQNYNITATDAWQGFNENSAFKGYLEYRIFYHTNNGNNQATLLKPIVIIDGFDPGDTRKIEDSDSNLPPEEHVSMYDFMSYLKSDGQPEFLIPLLRDLGYDVVIVNQPTHSIAANGNVTIDGGADYIERNALAHVALYQSLNARLAQNNSNEGLVIVGPSMGGQISRYALAYMEKEDIVHNTRLWVSIDSPHLGANIPMGLQSLLNQIKDDVPAAEDFVVNELGSAAAKQQLIEQYNGTNGNQLNTNYLDGKAYYQGFSSNRGHPLYVNYYNNLFTNGLAGSRGYPKNLRKIALVNGALKNTKSYFNPFTAQQDNYNSDGEIGLNVRGFQTFCTPWPFCWDELIASLEAYTMPDTNENLRISRYKQAFSDESLHVTNINTRGTMDNIPGGWFPGFNELAKSVEGNDDPFPYISSPFWSFHTFSLSNIWALLSDLYGGAELSLYNNEHVSSFIPTFSSLGFLQPDQSWSENLNRDLTCANEIPFDTYFGPKNNEQHTSFTQKSVDWLLGELDGIPQPATVYRGDTPTVYGPAILCHDDIVSYDLLLCSAINTQWEVSPNLDIEIATDNFVVVTPKSYVDQYYGQQGFIKATIGNVVINRNMWVGLPTTPDEIEGPNSVHVGSRNTYRTNNGGGAQSYQWSLPQPFDPEDDTVTHIDGSSNHWQMLEMYSESKRNIGVFSGNGGYEGDITVIGVNSCGDGLYPSTLAVTQNNSGPCPTCLDPIQVVPVPNSANEEFKLDFAQHPPGTYYIYIFDANSNIMYQGETENYEKTVDTTELPNGIYYLHIHDGNEVTSQQLYIHH